MITAVLVITAAGGSSRWSGNASLSKKEFATLKNGKTVLFSSLMSVYKPLEEYIKAVAIVYHPVFLEETKQALEFDKLDEKTKSKLIFVKGGDSRAESTKNGIEALKTIQADYIITHDGARPFASENLVKHIFEDVLVYSVSVPYLSLTDSIKMVKGEFAIANVKREEYVSVQTPQVFKKAILEEAYSKYYDSNATDDSALVFNSGHSVHLVKGERKNKKITYKEDIL